MKWSDFDGDALLTETDAAALLVVSVHSLRSWRNKDVPKGPRFVRVGTLVRYRIADLRRFVERNSVSTSDDPIPVAPQSLRRSA